VSSARPVRSVRSFRPILLIDGRSGSGKTDLATALAADSRTASSAGPGAQVLRLDSIYPGWGGLAAGSALVPGILATNRWQRWDWATSRYAEWHTLDPTLPLIIEGCGALSRENRALASHGVWVELDDATRKARALARDGEAYAPHWDEWAAQELAFIARENPVSLADDVVAGAAINVSRWRALLDPARVEL
jgi:hypothetical protein